MLRSQTINTIAGIAALLSGSALFASNITVSNSAGVYTSTPGVTTFDDFDGTYNTSIGTVSGGGLDQGANPGGGGNWAYVAFGGPVATTNITVTFTSPVTEFGFLWGSMDNFNQVDVFDGAVDIGTVTGNTNGLSTGFVNFDANPGYQITSVLLSNGGVGCCFEVDNFAAGNPTPEPSSWSLAPLGLALLCCGVPLTRRSRSAA